MVTIFLNAVTLEEAKQQSGSAPYERTSEITSHRNRLHKRTLKTPNVTLHLDKQQLRGTLSNTLIVRNIPAETT